MASFDQSLGMWKAKNGRYYASEAEAQNADSNTLDDGDFMGASGIEATAPGATQRAPDPRDQPNPSNPGGISDNELARRQNKLQGAATTTANTNYVSTRGANQGSTPEQMQAAYNRGNTGGATGAYNSVNGDSRANFDYLHEIGSRPAFTSARGVFNQFGEGVGISHAGDVTDPANVFHVVNPMDVLNNPGGTLLGSTADPQRGLGVTGLPGVPGGASGGRSVANMSPGTRAAAQYAQTGNLPSTPIGGGSTSGGGGTTGDSAPAVPGNDGRATIDKETADAKTRALSEIDQNKDENNQLFADAFAKYDALNGGDYGMSDEARGYQREGLQQQRMLLNKMLGYDENAAATRYGDQALARTIAAGRSGGGGYAGQQAGMMAALDQAPSLYAEGARQANAENNQRLQMAETASKSFGDLGTMTRGQDEQRAQYEATLQKGIADSVANLTQGNVQMNQQDSQQMAEIWMDFAKLQSVYAGMSSQEQLAWWQQETARRGQDQNFKAITDQLKAQGKITPKDLIGGLFTLGGGVLSAGGSIANANIQGQTARDVAAINAGQAPATASGFA